MPILRVDVLALPALKVQGTRCVRDFGFSLLDILKLVHRCHPPRFQRSMTLENDRLLRLISGVHLPGSQFLHTSRFGTRKVKGGRRIIGLQVEHAPQVIHCRLQGNARWLERSDVGVALVRKWRRGTFTLEWTRFGCSEQNTMWLVCMDALISR